MNRSEREVLRELNEQLSMALRGNYSARGASPPEPPELAELCRSIASLSSSLAEAVKFITALSQGKLEEDPPMRNPILAPFKQLHANLRHLTWQTRQIASGDLDQRVDFLGEFSVAFNSMIEALREKKLADDKVRYLSMHDTLSGLYNRRYFEEEMERVEKGRMFPVSIIMADMDNMKWINDNLGHASGDSAIRDAAGIIRQAVRSNDVVARMGGDEFAAILPGADAGTASAVVDRIRMNEYEYNRESGEYRVALSIGIATSDCGVPLAETLKRADEMMYRDKFSRKEALSSSGNRKHLPRR